MSQRVTRILLSCLAVCVVVALGAYTLHRRHAGGANSHPQLAADHLSAKPGAQRNAAANPRLKQTLGHFPLSFERRDSDKSKEPAYVSSGNGYSLAITKDGAALRRRFQLGDDVPTVLNLEAALIGKGVNSVSDVRFSWLSANPASAPAGEDRQRGYSNYFPTSDRKTWRTHVQHYGGVRLPELYNGIDLRFHGDHSALEFDYIVRAGADPNAIRLGISAPSIVSLTNDGELQIMESGDTIRLEKPIAYQTIHGVRKSVDVKFALAASHEAHFVLGDYDHSTELVIDPVLAFSAFFGASSNLTAPADIALDASGNIYITGHSCDVDYPVTPGAYQTSGGSIVNELCDSAIITELDPTASTLLYSTYLGPENAVSVGMKVLPVSSGALVAGFTTATNFPVTSNAYQKTAGSGTCNYGPNIKNFPCSDGFLLELSPDGSSLVFSTYLGGTRAEILDGMAVDTTGSIYVSGATNSADFVVTAGAADGSYGGGMCQGGLFPCFDGFVSKLSSDGSKLLASTYLGGNDEDFIGAVTLDSSANVYVAGTSYSTNFPTTPGSVQPTHSAGADQGDAFVSKLTSDLTALTYSTFIGGTGYDFGLGVAVDSSGEAFVFGTTDSTDFPITSGSFQTTYAGPASAEAFCPTALDTSLLLQPSCGDIFVAKLNAAGSSKLYSTYIGGSQADIAMRAGLDSSGNLWLTANTNSTDFPYTADAYYASTGTNVALMELSSDGTKLLYATPLVQGMAGQGLASGLTIDSSNDIYVAGQSESFMATPGTFASGTGPTIFIAKYTQAMAAPAVTLSATTLTFPQTSVGSASAPQSVTLTNSGTATLDLQVTMPLLLGETSAGPFSEYDNCGTTLAAGVSCTINATYQPTNPQSGGDGGSITITSNAPNAPQTVQLLGTPVLIDYSSFVPPVLTFNGQGPGTTSTSQLSGLQSPGTSQYTIAAAPVSAPTISGPNASEFQVDSSSCQIGQHYCTLNVTFSPAAGATGQRTATVTVATNAPNTPNTLSLVGNVSTGPYAVFTGPFLDPTTVGTPTSSSFSITNTGGATLNVTAEPLTGANPGDFALQSASCNLPSFSLTSGQACSVYINFTPGAQGTRSATLTLVDNESKPASTVITGFAGTSTSAAFLLNSVPSLTNNVGLFPDTVVGTTGSSDFLVSVQNLGKGSGNVTSATLTGDFVQFNTCTGPIAPSNACQYTVTFAPTTSGTRTGTLTIVTNAPGNQTFTVNFSGNGALAPQVSLAPPLINFGPVPLNTPSPTQSATLKNTGNAPLSISNVAITGPFTQTNNCGSSVAAGANCAFNVLFTPTTQGDSGGLLSFKANAAGGFFTVALNGSGAAGSAPLLTPTSLNFGNQTVGTVSPAQSVTLSNQGSAPFTFTGVQPSENFQASSTCPASIAPQTSCTISVKFAPTTDTFPAPFPANGAVYVAVGAKGSPLSIQTTGTALQGTGTVNIALSSTPNPSTVGQTVSVTATVTSSVSGGPTPTGTVQLIDNGTPTGSPAALSGGVGVIMISTLTQGNHSLYVQYSGDSNYQLTNSSGILQTVNASGKATTTTAVTSTPNPATSGQSVKFTATVMSATAGTITGTVTFFDGATQLGTPITLASGSASYSTTTLSQGTHSITAQYSGDTNYSTSTSTAITQTINASGKATTTTGLTSSLNPSTTGASVTFTAAVSSTTAGTITGTVSFFDGATQIGTPVTLTGGAAQYTTSALAQGTHSVTAQYSGDTNYSTSTSPVVSQVVNAGSKATTTTGVTSSLNPSTVGASVTFTAAVSSATAGTITGSVTFYDGGTALGAPVTLTAGTAVFSTSSLAQGSHSITAQYSGDANYSTSTSPVLSQTVNAAGTAATTTALTTSPNPSTVGAGVTLSATVTSATAGTISGSISFYDGTLLLDTPITMTGNTATYTNTKFAQGTHTITARYNGNANFAVSTSTPVSQVVNAASKAATTTAVSSSLNPSTVNASVTFTAAVSSATAGTITGTATFFDGATQLGTPVTITGGMAAYTTTALAQGTHSITAQYSGDTNYATSTSTAVSQVVNAAGTGDFSVSVAPTSLSVQAGRSGSFAVSIAPLNGSTETVTLSCSQLPANSTCSFATPTVTLDGTHTATVSAAINTNSNSTVGPLGDPQSDGPKQPTLPASWQLVASLFAAIGSLALIRTSRNRAWRLALAMVLLILPALSITACSNMPGGKNTGKGNYTITVSGTSGMTTHSASLAVTVN